VFQSQLSHSVGVVLTSSAAGRTAAAAHQAQLTAAFTSGQVQSTIASFPNAQRAAVLHAYRVGFSSTLDHLMVIAAIVAFIGSLAAVGLVRQEDFVPSGAPPDNGPTTDTRGG
jgi:hypothetical protein